MIHSKDEILNKYLNNQYFYNDLNVYEAIKFKTDFMENWETLSESEKEEYLKYWDKTEFEEDN